MVGLMYKDFVAIGGKYLVCAMTAFLVIMTACSFLFTNPTTALVLALIALTFVSILIIWPIVITEARILGHDAKKKQNFTYSLPTGKKKFVAAKYLFFLIMEYGILSYTILLMQLAQINAQAVGTEDLSSKMTAVSSFLPLFIGIYLLNFALETPFFLVLGYKTGTSVKTVLLVAAMFSLVVFMLFGDASVLNQFDLYEFTQYLKDHPVVAILLEAVAPVVSGGLYYLSYRVTAYLVQRREMRDE